MRLEDITAYVIVGIVVVLIFVTIALLAMSAKAQDCAETQEAIRLCQSDPHCKISLREYKQWVRCERSES